MGVSSCMDTFGFLSPYSDSMDTPGTLTYLRRSFPFSYLPEKLVWWEERVVSTVSGSLLKVPEFRKSHPFS